VFVRADCLTNYRAYPIAFLVPAVVALALTGMIYFSQKKSDRNAFTCSCVYLSTMLVGAAIALFPRLLPATTGSAYDITIEKALSGPHTLYVGLIWWSLGMLLAFGYVVIVYRMFRGKVTLHDQGYGH
jgi:cytochrome bd ubiquinol oxidase subunit II